MSYPLLSNCAIIHQNRYTLTHLPPNSLLNLPTHPMTVSSILSLQNELTSAHLITTHSSSTQTPHRLQFPIHPVTSSQSTLNPQPPPYHLLRMLHVTTSRTLLSHIQTCPLQLRCFQIQMTTNSITMEQTYPLFSHPICHQIRGFTSNSLTLLPFKMASFTGLQLIHCGISIPATPEQPHPFF